MSEYDFSELGREIGEKINKFVNSKEIKDLQENIRATVETTMGEVQRATKEASEQWKSHAEYQREKMQENGKKQKETGSYYSAYSSPYAPNAPDFKASRNEVQNRLRQLPVVRKPGGRVAGVLCTVFGTIGSVAGWTASLFSGFLFFAAGNLLGTVSLGLSLGGAAFFTLLAVIGGYLRRRAFRFKKYVKTMGVKDFYPIEGLAGAVSKNEKFVVKDIEKMIRRGWFKEGHLDENKTCFMLTDESYQMYLDAEEELKQRKEEEERRKAEEEQMEQDPLRKQLKIAVEEGKEYVRRIREANDDIPGEEISGKLDRLEAVGTKIFEYVEENPDKLPDIRKFMNYYMPTTLKLVEAYREFSSQPVQGENIVSAQQEIAGMLDDINKAFEKMFDRLFEGDAMDISTDISALSVMLAQEGLLEDEFKM